MGRQRMVCISMHSFTWVCVALLGWGVQGVQTQDGMYSYFVGVKVPISDNFLHCSTVIYHYFVTMDCSLKVLYLNA